MLTENVDCFTTPLHRVVYMRPPNRNTMFLKSQWKEKHFVFANVSFIIIKALAKSNVKSCLRKIKD